MKPIPDRSNKKRPPRPSAPVPVKNPNPKQGAGGAAVTPEPLDA